MGPRAKAPGQKEVAEFFYKGQQQDRTGRSVGTGELRNQLHQLLYVQDACKNGVAAIEALRNYDQDDEGGPSIDELLSDIKGEFHFLRSLVEDKEFLRSLSFVNKR